MKLKLEDNGDETFTLLEGVTWYDETTRTLIAVGRGEVTDFASVPRLLWPIIPPHGAHGFAAVVHDYLYRVRGSLPDRTLPRRDCDRIFREIMMHTGVRFSRRSLMWLAVRLFGWWPWHFGERPGNPAAGIITACAVMLMCTGCAGTGGTRYLESAELSGRQTRDEFTRQETTEGTLKVTFRARPDLRGYAK